MAAALTLGVEEELHLVDLDDAGSSPPAPRSCSRELPAEQLLGRAAAHHGRDQHRGRADASTSCAPSIAAPAPAAWSRWPPSEGLGVAAVGTAAAVSGRGLRADRAPAASAACSEDYRLARRRAADLRHAGARRRRRPRPRGAGRAAGRAATCRCCWRCRPARRTGTAPTPATPASARSSGSAGRPPGTTGPLDVGRRVRRPGRRPHRLRRDRRRQDGLLRRPARRRTCRRVELRVCDACPLVDDAVLIAGLFRALVRRGGRGRRGAATADAGAPRRCTGPRCGGPRAAACAGGLLDDPAAPAARSRRRRSCARCVDRLRAAAGGAGDWDDGQRADRGRAGAAATPADRQRAAFAERGRLADVVAAGGRRDPRARRRSPPAAARRCRRLPAHAPATRRSRRPASPRPVYRPLFERARRARRRPGCGEREAARDRWAAAARARPSASAASSSRSRSTSCRASSRPHEWAVLAAGLDPAGPGDRDVPARRLRRPAAIVRDGVLTGGRRLRRARLARRGAGSCPPARCARRSWASTSSATTSAAGGCSRTTSACPPASATRSRIRQLMRRRAARRCRGPTRLLDPRTALELLRPHAARVRRARHDPAIALLSDGAGNSAWFEHRLLAERRRLLLVAARRRRRRAAAWSPAGRRRVDVLYLRLDVELVDLVDAARPPDRRRDHARPRRGGPSRWPTRRATASPTTRRCTATCPT